MAKKSLQEELHIIMRPIRYHNPASEHNGKRIEPGDGLFLAFPHLSDAQILLLRKRRVIAPATPAEIKAVEDARRVVADAKVAAEKAEAERLRQSKAAAIKKQLQIQNEVNDNG